MISEKKVLGIKVLRLKKREEELEISLQLSISKATDRIPPTLFQTMLSYFEGI